MTDWNLSVVLIVPSDLREKASRLSCVLGHDELPGSTFSVPLSSTGELPATHYGCRTTAKQEFIDIIYYAKEGNDPNLPLSEFGLTFQDVADVLEHQILSVEPAETFVGHFQRAIEEGNLKPVVIPDEEVQ